MVTGLVGECGNWPDSRLVLEAGGGVVVRLAGDVGECPDIQECPDMLTGVMDMLGDTSGPDNTGELGLAADFEFSGDLVNPWDCWSSLSNLNCLEVSEMGARLWRSENLVQMEVREDVRRMANMAISTRYRRLEATWAGCEVTSLTRTMWLASYRQRTANNNWNTAFRPPLFWASSNNFFLCRAS